MCARKVTLRLFKSNQRHKSHLQLYNWPSGPPKPEVTQRSHISYAERIVTSGPVATKTPIVHWSASHKVWCPGWFHCLGPNSLPGWAFLDAPSAIPPNDPPPPGGQGATMKRRTWGLLCSGTSIIYQAWDNSFAFYYYFYHHPSRPFSPLLQ